MWDVRSNSGPQMWGYVLPCFLLRVLKWKKRTGGGSWGGWQIQNKKHEASLIGGFNPSERYKSQLGWLFPIYGKSKKSCSKPPTSSTKEPPCLTAKNNRFWLTHSIFSSAPSSALRSALPTGRYLRVTHTFLWSADRTVNLTKNGAEWRAEGDTSG